MSAAPTAGSPPAGPRTRGCCAAVADPLAADVAERLATVFAALADPTRVQIVHVLRASADPVCVCDLTPAFALSQPTVSHHLARLRQAGLVTSTRRGIWSFYRLADDLPEAALAALDAIP
ncbi:MAG TPA: metalloregulator ArsR/SmtB family transcription factor [Candidatus Micrarchaeia archaeon]|nr:metalloregulator ArsR/SmtB family transcription factor [Candidatus Micrarchaeia archaeon]